MYPGEKRGKLIRRHTKWPPNRGNKVISSKMSIAEELVSLITYEEYPEDVEAFGDTDYLNKNEVCALKKMISGKLWG